eukprot:UN07323
MRNAVWVFLVALTVSNGFNGLELYSKIYDDSQNDNICFSPLSLVSCFSLLYPGSTGNSENEIREVLVWTRIRLLRLTVM